VNFARGGNANAEHPPPYELAINGRRIPAPFTTYTTASSMTSPPSSGGQYSPQNIAGSCNGSLLAQFDLNHNAAAMAMALEYGAGMHGQLSNRGVTLGPPTTQYIDSERSRDQNALHFNYSPTATGLSCGLEYANSNNSNTSCVNNTRRSSQPLSPVHRQMIEQKRHQYDAAAAINGTTFNNTSQSAAVNMHDINGSTDAGLMLLQYPTPPSHHSGNDPTSPPMISQQSVPAAMHYPGYPTPSPEASPGQWSSSSPNSARSDWSEQARNSSPQRPVASSSLPSGNGIKDEPGATGAYL